MITKTAQVHQLRGITLAAKTDSNHWVIMDGPEEFGGSNAGPTPKELLLIALGGCTATDVIPIMRKKRVPFDRCDIHLSATVRDEHPRTFTGIHVEYVVYGTGINHDDVARAVELSITKYCSISAMLCASVPLTHSIRIEPDAEPPSRP